MAPLKDIKNGILTGNWDLVVEGYNALTGDDLAAPVQTASSGPMTLEQITEALKALQTVSPRGETPEMSEIPPKRVAKAKKVAPAKPKKKPGRPAKKAVLPEANDTEEINDEPDDLPPGIEIPRGLPKLNVDPKDQKVIPYTPDAVDPKLAKENQKVANKTPNEYRPPYKPHNIKCAGCNHRYDGNKAIAGGIIGDSEGTTKYKCPKCKELRIE